MTGSASKQVAKRRPPAAGKGRPKGSKNKVPAEIKKMVIDALDAAGGVAYLKAKAKTNPNAFLGLVGKVLPLQIAGDKNAPLVVHVVQVTNDDEQKQAWQKP